MCIWGPWPLCNETSGGVWGEYLEAAASVAATHSCYGVRLCVSNCSECVFTIVTWLKSKTSLQLEWSKMMMMSLVMKMILILSLTKCGTMAIRCYTDLDQVRNGEKVLKKYIFSISEQIPWVRDGHGLCEDSEEDAWVWSHGQVHSSTKAGERCRFVQRWSLCLDLYFLKNFQFYFPFGYNPT